MLHLALNHQTPDYQALIQTISTGLVLGLGWLLPAIFAGASALFGGISAKKQRDEQNRQRDQAWAKYQQDYRAYIDQQNKKRALFKWYADQKGWKDQLGPLYDQVFSPLDYSSVPTGSAPHQAGSFFGDVLGQALGAVPGLILSYKGPKAPVVNTGSSLGRNILGGVGSLYRGVPGTDFDPFSGPVGT